MSLTPNVIAKAMLKGHTKEEVYAVIESINAYIDSDNGNIKNMKKDSHEYETMMEFVLMNSTRILNEGETNVVD